MSHDLHFTVEGGEVPSGMMDSGLSPAAAAQQEPVSKYSLKNSAHPTVSFFHLFFKAAALAIYACGKILTRGAHPNAKFIIVSVVCILLLAADFWVTKNITGRLLVGLRWWNQVEGETTRWIFESKGDEANQNKFDRSVFWTVLYLTPVVWGCYFLLALFRLELGWILVATMAIALSSANIYGYYKCSSDQKAKFQQMIATGAQRGAMAAVRSNLFGMMIGAAAANNNAAPAAAAAATPANNNTFAPTFT